MRLAYTNTHSIGGVWGADPGGDQDLPVVRVADFNYEALQVNRRIPTSRSISASERAARLLEPGDILLEKSGGGLTTNVGRAVLYTSPEPAVCSNFIQLLRPAPGYDPRFLVYLHRVLYVRGVAAACTKQNTGIQNLGVGDYLATAVDVPTIERQRATADFLGRACERLDAVVARLASASSLARLAAAATVDELVAVTGAPRVKVRHLTTLITSGPRGWSDHERDGGTVPFLGIAALHRDSLEVRAAALRWLEPPDNAERARASTQDGDVLVSITAELGTVCVTRASAAGAVISQHVALLRPDPRYVVPDWLAYSLKSTSGKRQLADLGRGGTKQGLSLDDVGAPLVSVPHPTEQKARLVEIRRREGASAGLVAVAEQAAARLAEYRDALTTEAVTGQIDVTAVSDAQMDERLHQAVETATA